MSNRQSDFINATTPTKQTCSSNNSSNKSNSSINQVNSRPTSPPSTSPHSKQPEHRQSNSNSSHSALSNGSSSSFLVNNSNPHNQNNESNKHLINKCLELIRTLKLRLVAFDFDCTIVTIHTGGQWLDTAAKLAEFVRPCFRDLIPALLINLPDIHLAVVTYSPQEKLIRDVLRIAMKGEHEDIDSLISRVAIKGNTKLFIEQYGLEPCYTSGKQLHLNFCRNYFENAKAFLRNNNSNQSAKRTEDEAAASEPTNLKINDDSILLIDDDITNVKMAIESGHLAWQVDSNMRLVDFIDYLKYTLVNK